MAFIGTPLDTRNTFQSLVGKRFNGDGSETDFTLDVAPSSVLDIEVFVGNVRQDPNSAYTLSGTTLTFTGAPPSGTNNIYVVHQAKAVGTIEVPATNSGDTTFNGTITMNGGVVLNEESADVDFRVESNGNANMLFVSGGNDVVGIGAEGDLGVGLHVKSADSGASVDGGANELVIEGSGDVGLSILSGTSGEGSIYFGDSGNNNIGYLAYRHDGNYLGFGVNGAEPVSIRSDGKVLINTASDLGNAQGVLHVKGKSNNNIARFGAGTNGEAIIFVNESNTAVGAIAVNASATAFETSSDYRLKENVDYTWDATTRLKELKPARFNWIVDKTNTLIDGFIAHEVSSVVPEAISGEKDAEEMQGIDQSKLVPLLTKALQEAITKIETLETKVTALENA